MKSEIVNSTKIPTLNSLVNVLVLKGKTFNNFILRYEEIIDGKCEVRTGFLHNIQSGWVKSNFLRANQVWLAKPDMKLEKGQWIFKLVCPVNDIDGVVFKKAISTPEKIYLTTSNDQWNMLNTNEQCVFELARYGEEIDGFFRKIYINSNLFFKFSEILQTLFENKSQFKKFQIKGGFVFTDTNEE